MLPVSLNSSSSFLTFASNPFIVSMKGGEQGPTYHLLAGQWEKKLTKEGGEPLFLSSPALTALPAPSASSSPPGS